MLEGKPGELYVYRQYPDSLRTVVFEIRAAERLILKNHAMAEPFAKAEDFRFIEDYKNNNGEGTGLFTWWRDAPNPQLSQFNIWLRSQSLNKTADTLNAIKTATDHQAAELSNEVIRVGLIKPDITFRM